MAIENSIIVPAYHEHDNIRPLTKRLFAALESEAPASELIFVDDNSKDGSVEEVAALKAEGFNVSIIVRTKERGLSSAVVKGFMEASGKYLVCMDADLQVSSFRYYDITIKHQKADYWGHSTHRNACQLYCTSCIRTRLF